MTNSSWRDDYQRIVPNRAQAYSGPLAGPWRLNMPFMNVYGNGGMLTTVGDWLKWNAMLDSRSLGSPLVDAMETVGVLNDGRKITYALGVIVTKPNGFRMVSHDGSTAGYQTILTRYPDLKLSTAVMCNSGSRSPGAIERDIFNEIMGPFTPPTPPEAVDIKPEELQKFAGFWRDDKTHFPIRTTIVNGKLQFADVPLRPISDRLFQVGSTKFNFTFDKDGRLVFLDRVGNDLSRYVAEAEWVPTSAELSSLAGRWYSEEADAIFSLVVDNGKAFLTQRPTTKVELRPQYKEGFTVNGQPGTVVWFTRDNSKVMMHVGTSRLRDMTFVRIS